MRDFDEPQAPLTRSAVMALLDEAMVRVALDKVNAGREVQRELLALDMNLSFMKSAVGPLLATAQVVGGGKTMCFCEAQLRNAQAELVAQAMGTYRAQSR